MESPTSITITRDDLASPWQRIGAAVIDGLLLGFPWGLIPLPVLWDQSRQGLHDKFADTLVLRNHAVPWA